MIISEEFMRVRQGELLAEAERSRLLAISRRNSVTVTSTSARFLVWIGGLLRMWGCRLEERFSVDVCVNQAQSVNRGLNV